jgi:hypothetical protein
MGRFCEAIVYQYATDATLKTTLTMLGNLLEAPSDPFGEAGFDEVVLAVLPEAFFIKGGFEVLEGESEIEDVYVGVYRQKASATSG